MRRFAFVAAALAFAAASPAVAADGAKVFQAQCKACHQGNKSTPMAPTLSKVAGRKIASLGDFKYSNGLKAKTAESWTDANLNAFLSGPMKFAPGTKMPIMVAKADDRAALIAHLKTLK